MATAISTAGITLTTLPPPVRACFNTAPPPIQGQQVSTAQRNQINAIQSLAWLESRSPQPPYFLRAPTHLPPTWAALWAQLPQPNYAMIAAIETRLATQPLIASPNALNDVHTAAGVNAFLAALQAAFPFTPPSNTSVGARVIPREIIAASSASVAAMYPEEQANFATIPAALQDVRRQAGTLALISSGPSLAFANSSISIRLEAMIQRAHAHDDTDQATALLRILARARQIHDAGCFDWHELGLFIIGTSMFVYDPSAIAWNQDSPGTHAYFTDPDTGVFPTHRTTADPGVANVPPTGIHARHVARINMVNTFWQRGTTSANAPLGARSSLNVWIGGGGNWTSGQQAGACRPMVGNWLLVIAALQWARRTPTLTAAQQ